MQFETNLLDPSFFDKTGITLPLSFFEEIAENRIHFV